MANVKQEPTTHQENISKLAELVKGIDIAMFTTLDSANNRLYSRPMSTQELEFDGQLWFFAWANSTLAQHIKQHPQVNVGYAETGKHKYVSVSGAATIVRDRAKMEKFWNPIYKVWFPNGIDDPNVCLVRVDVDEAEYWEAPSGPVNKLVGFVKALVTGDDDSMGENKTIKL